MGTGIAYADGDVLPASKINDKLETVDGSDINAGASRAQTMLFNSFNCPAPGTDWTPDENGGCTLGASKSAKKFTISTTGLKIGDIITSYKCVGDATEAAGITLDCKLITTNKADPITTTDITNGAITQVDADGNFDSEANCDDTTVVTDKQLSWLITGTTGAGDSITIMGIEAAVTRLVGAPA
jgi:hypothetical protein